MKVAVLGASPRPERYAHKAMVRLLEKGHDVLPVHPVHEEIEGRTTVPSLAAVAPGSVDTVTVYVSPEHSTPLAGDFLKLHPRRVIFNPGAENPALARLLEEQGIETEEACTLVLLATDRF